MKPKLNVKLLRQIQKAILSHPDQFMMHDVFSTQLEDGGVAGGCGTAACIAGWALHLHSKNKNIKITESLSDGNLLVKAAKLLGITFHVHQNNSVFHVFDWPMKFRIKYRRALYVKTESIAKVAADRIDHLIKTGK